MHKATKRLILLELNEINFDVVAKYVAQDAARFPSLKKSRGFENVVLR